MPDQPPPLDDLIRTELQETGRVSLSYVTLYGLLGAVGDLGIDPAKVEFEPGYAVVRAEAERADAERVLAEWKRRFADDGLWKHPDSLGMLIRETVAALESLLAERAPADSCPECEDRREVEATPGQPGDGPMPCPRCAPADSDTARLAREARTYASNVRSRAVRNPTRIALFIEELADALAALSRRLAADEEASP